MSNALSGEADSQEPTSFTGGSSAATRHLPVDAIRRALVAEGDVSDSDARWIVDLHVFTRLDESNVHDVLKLLAYEFPAMNRALWAAVNKAPRIESDWETLFFIGSNMSDEDQQRSRSHLRRAVELVRSATPGTGSTNFFS